MITDRTTDVFWAYVQLAVGLALLGVLVYQWVS